MLAQPFTFDTETISEKLFEPETKTIEVTPSTFFSELSERYDAAITHWRELNDAVTLSLHLADELFPHQGLDSLLAKARENAIPERWLAAHPLMGDDRQDTDLYAQIDARRLEDPYAFALEIHALRETEEARAHELDRLVSAVALANSNTIEELQGLEDTVLRPEDDPEFTLSEARYALGQVAPVLASADAVEEVEAHAQRIVDLFAKCDAQSTEAREAIVQASGSLRDADSLLEECRRLDDETLKRLAEVARDHKQVEPVGQARSAADQFVEAGVRDLQRARAKLEERRHLEALRAARQASEQFSQARSKQEAALDICAELDALKARYEETLAQMESQREEAVRRVQRYRGAPSLVGGWVTPQFSGPGDYAFHLAALMEQRRQWDEAARAAQRAYEALELQRRQAEEAARRARQQALYSDSSHSSFGGSFGGGGGSGSSGGSFGGGGSGSLGGSW